MATPNLAISHIQAAQDQKEITANEAYDILDNALNSFLAIANTDADQTLTIAQMAAAMVISITGAITAERKINLPVGMKRFFVFQNATTGGQKIFIQVLGALGSSVEITNEDGLVLLYCDGTNVIGIAFGGGGTVGAGSSSGANFADSEIPAGTIDGSNRVFTLNKAPNPPESLKLFKNGRRMMTGDDFNLSGLTFTYVAGVQPQAGDIPDTHIADYRY
jgi:hypothetical protein